ncbi:MAG: TRAP transporter small permease [Deltaproteobacteria bacterium]|nr:TRAP transporter small permease [Deltaproteobacteria bacterium]
MSGRLHRLADRFEKTVYPLSKWLYWAAQVIIALMVILTVTDVFLRYVFNRPIVGSFELTEFLMVFLVFASISYTMAVKGHVYVDLVVSRLPSRVSAVIECIISLLAFLLFALVTWRNFLHAGILWERNDISHELSIPIGPFVYFIALGVAVLCLVLLVQFLQSLAQAVKK